MIGDEQCFGENRIMNIERALRSHLLLAMVDTDIEIAKHMLTNDYKKFTEIYGEEAQFLLFSFAKKYADFLTNGFSVKNKITEADVDAHELEMGIEVEYEHTGDREIAKRIALDHLAEIPNYYTLLKKMEETAKKKGQM